MDLGSIANTIGSWSKQLVSVFDNGWNIYQNVQDRIDAIEAIDNETVQPAAKSSSPISFEMDIGKQTQAAINTISYVLIGAGIIVLLIIILSRRK